MKMIAMDWAIMRIAEWISIKEDEAKKADTAFFYGSLKISAADIDHSALLRRLLDGERPFKYPPPRSFSYPWYEVMDGKEHSVMEVWVDSQGLAEYVVINQSRWNILRKEGNTYIIQQGRDPTEWKLWRRPEEELATDKNVIGGFNEWKLQRQISVEE
jgi:hypothetical protein